MFANSESCSFVLDVGACGEKDLARLGSDDVLGKATAHQVDVKRALVVEHGRIDAIAGAAVLFVHDDVLRDVDETTGEVTGVGGTKRRIRHTLSGAVRGDEVFENGQALAEVRLDRTVDDLALRVGHEAAHARELANLLDVTSSAGVRHHVDGVEAIEVLAHRVSDLVGCAGPDVDDLAVALGVAHEAHLVVFLDRVDLCVSGSEDLVFLGRDRRVVDGDGDARARGVVVADGLQAVEDLHHLGRRVAVGAVLDELADLALVHDVVDVGMVFGQHAVEDDAADGGLDQLAGLVLVVHAVLDLDLGVVLETHLDLGLQVNVRTGVIGVLRVLEVHEHAPLAREPVAGGREVVHADDHILRRNGERLAVCRRFDVVGREHEHARLGLRLGRQRHVDCHLVAVEVGVEGGADERVQADCLAFHQDRLERLDAQTVQGWRAVEHDGVVRDDLFEDVPDDGCAAVDHALGRLDVCRMLELDQALHHERLEQLEGHLLGNAALVDLELRADADDGTAGVVDALAEQVLAEAALLALEHVGERLERAVAGADDRTAATAVVEQGVDCLLQHALLVVDDDLGRGQVEQLLQAVVAVDDAAVQVVQVGGREAATVELHHRAQVGRDDRDDVEDHVMRLVVAAQEGLDDLQALDGLRALLALAGLDGLAELFGSRLEVDGIEQVADGFRAHAAAEVVAVVRAHLAIERLVGDEHLRFDLEEHVERLGTQVLALLEVVTQVLDLALDLVGRHEIVFVVLALALFVEVLGALMARELDQAVALGVELFELSGQLFLSSSASSSRASSSTQVMMLLAKYRTFSRSFGEMSSR